MGQAEPVGPVRAGASIPMKAIEQNRGLAFVSHLPLDIASGGGVYARAVFDMLESCWPGGKVRFVGPAKNVRPSRVLSVLRALVSARPSKVVFAERSGLADAPSKFQIGPDDVICLNSPDTFPLLERNWPDAPFFLVCHNIEADLFREQVARLPFPARLLLSSDARRYAEIEDRAFRNARLIVTISDSEAEGLRTRFPAAIVIHIPPVFESAPPVASRPAGAETINLGFVGRMSWWPNREAVDWLKNVLSPVPAGREVHFYGVGTEDLNDPEGGWIGHGFMEDGDAMWNSMHVALCPMVSGGGANIKLVEALARGVPVLTTSFGMRGLGLPLHDRPGLRILDGSDDWRAFVEGDGIRRLSEETADPEIAAHFSAARHSARLLEAMDKVGLMQ